MESEKILYSLMLGGTLFCLFSCAKKDEFEIPTLVLSESSIAFDKGVSERSISITTNQNSWIASSPQEGDWFLLVQDGNALKVKVTESKIGTEHTNYVLVNTSGAFGKIAMTQSTADVTLDMVPNVIYLPQIGGEKTIDITVNSSICGVTTSEEVSWLKIVESREEIKLTVERDDAYQKREVKLYTKGDNVICETVVS